MESVTSLPASSRVRRSCRELPETATHLIPTSGSAGARKLIPFTAGLQRDFNRALGPWICDLAKQHPAILGGPAYWSITPAIQTVETEPSCVPIGFAHDASYLGGARKWLLQAALVAPNELTSSADMEEFRRQTLRCLVRQRELRFISVWHPSFLALLLDALPGHWEQLLADMPASEELWHADPRQPETIWPHLQVISCWGDAHAELALADLRRRFPRTHIQFKGLLATEAFVTIPFGDAHPLAVRSHFFEFIREDGAIQLAHELRVGGIYELAVTTSGGLWRYRLGDQVEVTGFAARTPSLRFVGRSGNVSDLCGEKLSDAFVGAAIREVAASLSVPPRFALVAPEQSTNGWHYTLFVEGEVEDETVGGRLETLLRANPNYAHCRALGQLGALRVFRITGRGQETFLTVETARGRQYGNIKPCLFSRETAWSGYFTGNYTL